MATIHEAKPAAERLAHGVSEFCQSHGISRATLYNLWRVGKGPQAFKVGKRTLISREAAEAWRRRLEAESARAA